MSAPVLQIKDLHAQYGESHILRGTNLTVNRGEAVTLLGRNGAGRTTTLCTIMGLVGMCKSPIIVHDADGQGMEMTDLPTHKIAHHDIGYCPEEHGTFSSLSCGGNLILSPVLRGQMAEIGNAGMSIDEVYRIFPNLAERHQSRSVCLSGGEQQMLVVGRTLRTGVNLLLLDEISEGLAPVIVQALARIILMFKERDYTVVMTEQNFRFATSLAGRFYVMEHGRIVRHFEVARLQDKMPVLCKLLGV